MYLAVVISYNGGIEYRRKIVTNVRTCDLTPLLYLAIRNTQQKRNASLRAVQLSGRSQVIGHLVYISAKVCQVLLRHTSFAITRRNCVKENWS